MSSDISGLKPTLCPKCRSAKVIPNVRILDHIYGGTVEPALEIQTRPHALMFKGGVARNLRAWVCGDCGYTELFVAEPHILWEAYQTTQQDDDQ